MKTMRGCIKYSVNFIPSYLQVLSNGNLLFAFWSNDN